ncbi:hypothetical protein B0H14DRAFT_3477564 [Mycena olivaceomarginata]|nr:hypothetical protein B0H14DRAFT_3477564 [Mycena olivaceomarginata]
MALPPPAERFMLTPLFREYPWRSDAFIFNRWLHEACEFKGLRPFAEFLARLDEQVPLASSTEFSDAETRALLGLPNNYSLHRSQAIGTALMWIIESRGAPDELYPTTTCVNNLYQVQLSDGGPRGSLTVGDLLRPLSYAINSSFMAVFCDLDLQKEYGHLLHQYETRMFLGCYRSPRLAYMEELVLTVVRDIAIGTGADESVDKFLTVDSSCMRGLPPSDLEDWSLFIGKSYPYSNDTTQAPDASDGPEPDWSALLAFDDTGYPDAQAVSGLGSHKSGIVPLDAEAIETSVVAAPSADALVETPLIQEHTVASAHPIVGNRTVVPGPPHSPPSVDTPYSDRTSATGERVGMGVTALGQQNRVVVEVRGPLPASHSSDLSADTGAMNVSDETGREAIISSNAYDDAVVPGDDENGSALAPEQDLPDSPPEFDSTTVPKRSARLNAMFILNGSGATKMASDGSASDKQAHRSSSKHPRAANGDMTVGKLDASVEDCMSILHRLDDEIEVQVCGLRKPPKQGYRGVTDYSDINRTTTLRRFLEHAKAEDPLVLNALKLPSSHTPHENPLVGSGFDLEDIAYRQTAGLPSFGSESPPNEKKCFDIMGTDGTLTLGHLDAAGGTQVSPNGPGDKFWIFKRDDADSVNNGFAFQSWDPDCPDFKSGRFEGILLPPRGGTLLMQNVEHIVLGLAPSVAGIILFATRMRPALSVHLHLVMLEHVLTNVMHDAQWQILVRICAFWLDLTSVRPWADVAVFAPYLPILGRKSATGWMDIVLLQYHLRESAIKVNRESDALVGFDYEDVHANIVDALETYSVGLGKELQTFTAEHSGFWLYSGDEFAITALF